MRRLLPRSGSCASGSRRRPAWCSTRRTGCAARSTSGTSDDAGRLALMRRVKERFDPARTAAAPASSSGGSDGRARDRPTRAFDETRPPSSELIDDCVHCGFCLPTCPTYSLWHEEMDSPRGRIVLMRAGLEEGSELSAELVTHIDSCLGCMACVTACPSGVQYDKLIEDTRAQVERHADRRPAERLFRRFALRDLPPPRPAAGAGAAARRRATARPRPRRRAQRPARRRFPRLRALAELAPRTPLRSSLRRLPPALRSRRERLAGASRCSRAASSGCSSATSTRRPPGCWPPRASRCTPARAALLRRPAAARGR